MIDGSICLDRMHAIPMIFMFEFSHSFGQKMCLPSGISNFWADFVLFGLLEECL